MAEPLSDVDIRIHALNLAVAQRRELFRFSRKEEDDSKGDPNWLAYETLSDARVYANWIANGDTTDGTATGESTKDGAQ